ncbi:Oidioi.mRNA.OKI2018_I69.XSR.g15259.t1.cds [Oikopleura dioica]|uniref:Oidioi.mRNA.OKI2018_I69.XSR.g15259.t1.cds n=1 Tax=Oikopleura dioica TaxID=34765 RepID=A0ABN7SJN2_OIKDI|nr:Oidioi.mRNA.OKI2018_I69.XSR.g15259.t1.cds [Oikopleura dioica]
MTDLNLPRFQPKKKKKKICGYFGSAMMFVLVLNLKSLYDRFVGAPRLYKVIGIVNDNPDAPHFDGEPEHSMEVVDIVDKLEKIYPQEFGPQENPPK